MKEKKISVLWFGLLLITVSACQKKQIDVACPALSHQDVPQVVPIVKQEKLLTDNVLQSEKKPRPVFDDELEGFVLEDESGNVFAPATEETEEDINVVEQDVADDVWFDKRADKAIELGFKAVYFDFDGYDIRPDQKPTLEYNLKKARELVDRGAILVVEGHACRYAGSAIYNMMLSEKRAKVAADFFVKMGIPSSRLKVVGRGYEMCIVPEGDVAQQSPNRRVEFYVLD